MYACIQSIKIFFSIMVYHSIEDSSLCCAACVLIAQSCPTLCNAVDCSPPGSSVHGILQARKLDWGAIPFSGGSPHPGIGASSPARHTVYCLSPRGVARDALHSMTLCAVCTRVLSHFSRVRLFATPQAVAHWAPLSVGVSWQEYRRGLSCPPPGDLSDPGIKPVSPASSAL